MKLKFYMIAVAALLLAACGKQESKVEPALPVEEVVAESVSEDPEASEGDGSVSSVSNDSVKVEDRVNYTVVIPSGWESKQYVSLMLVKNKGVELTFKEYVKSEIERVARNSGCSESNRLPDITLGDRKWAVYQNGTEFNTIYLTLLPNDEVLRVGSTINQADDPAILNVLNGVKATNKKPAEKSI